MCSKRKRKLSRFSVRSKKNKQRAFFLVLFCMFEWCININTHCTVTIKSINIPFASLSKDIVFEQLQLLFPDCLHSKLIHSFFLQKIKQKKTRFYVQSREVICHTVNLNTYKNKWLEMLCRFIHFVQLHSKCANQTKFTRFFMFNNDKQNGFVTVFSLFLKLNQYNKKIVIGD